MIVLTINVVLIICSAIILSNIYWGGIAYLVLGLVLPQFVPLALGPVSLNMHDLLCLCLLCSMLIHRKQLRSDYSMRKIAMLQWVYVLSALIVVLFATFVPLQTQLYLFLKLYLFRTVVLVTVCFFLFNNERCNKLLVQWVTWVAIGIGIYGLLCYYWHDNPYIRGLSLLYGDEYTTEFFNTQIRGALTGRVSGTTTHPLQWGQLWGILLVFFVFKREEMTKVRFWALMALACLNILFSGSRSALVAMVPLLACYVASEGSVKALRKMAMGLAVALALSYTLSDKMQLYLRSVVFFWDEQASMAADVEGSNTDMRIEQYNTLMHDVTRENIFVGYGLGYLGYANQRNVRNKDMLGYESVFFQIMAEQGLVGFVGFCCFMFQLYRLRAKRLERRKRIIYLGYCASYMVSIMLTGIQNTFGQYLLIGLFMVLSEKSMAAKRPVRKPTRIAT